jgi:hypothetical protein
MTTTYEIKTSDTLDYRGGGAVLVWFPLASSEAAMIYFFDEFTDGAPSHVSRLTWNGSWPDRHDTGAVFAALKVARDELLDRGLIR